MPFGTMVMPSGFKWNEQQYLALGIMVRPLGTVVLPVGFNGMNIGNGPLWTQWLCLWA